MHGTTYHNSLFTTDYLYVYRRLHGHSPHRIARSHHRCLGCNNFGPRLDAAATAKVVHAALDAGVNFFDTAELYGDGKSEEYLGRALEARRQDAIIASKFGHKSYGGNAKPTYIRQAIERSLKRLRIDCIDLYQLHTPDPDVPIADTLGAQIRASPRAGTWKLSPSDLAKIGVLLPPSWLTAKQINGLRQRNKSTRIKRIWLINRILRQCREQNFFDGLRRARQSHRCIREKEKMLVAWPISSQAQRSSLAS